MSWTFLSLYSTLFSKFHQIMSNNVIFTNIIRNPKLATDSDCITSNNSIIVLNDRQWVPI